MKNANVFVDVDLTLVDANGKLVRGLTEFFEGFSAKPDIIIDDMPSTCVSPFAYSVQQQNSWPELAERIIQRHVD